MCWPPRSSTAGLRRIAADHRPADGEHVDRTLIFLPGLAGLAAWGGWKPVVLTIAGCALALIPLIAFLVPESPAAIGLRRYGATEDEPAAPAPAHDPFTVALGDLMVAARTRTFWFLFATFFICGFTTNGLVGTHLIAFCGDNGIAEVHAAACWR